MLLYKDAVMPIEGIAPVSQTWAKKHILGFSDEEIKLDLQQQRVKKRFLRNSKYCNVITKTGLFDNIDKLYGNGGSPSGATETDTEGGLGDVTADTTIPDTGFETAETPTSEVTPESLNKKMNIILEKENFGTIQEIDLNKGNRSLGEMEKELGKLID
jgi:hypothetical protein